MKRILPALVLFFLAPAIAELLSGSAPPVEFFNPFGFVLLTALYGSGVILARELTIRWRKGWLSLFALGAAYGIIEEGLMVKSFFDPNWVDIGILGSYGRWAGVNWVWSVELTIYHAVISIIIPILLTELIFANRRNQTWVRPWGLIGFSVLLLAVVAFGYFLLTPYRPPTIPYLLMVAVVVGLILLAWRLPHQPSTPKTLAIRHPFRFWLTGFLGTIGFFLVFMALPDTGLHPGVTIFIGVGLVAMIVWMVSRMSGNGTAWTEMHRLALAASSLSLFILLTPIHQFDTSRTDNPSGMAFVGLAALGFLLWLWRWVRSGRGRPVNYDSVIETTSRD
jgi:hypothetical protein